MNFKSLLAQGRLRPHSTNKEEIQEMLRIAMRDLDDASVQGLSADRRFLIAYDASLTLATIPLHCSGYETHGAGHHWMTFQVLPYVMGADLQELSEYFELCRTKRNVGTYDRGGQISEAEAEELITEVKSFKTLVEAWLRAHHPEYI